MYRFAIELPLRHGKRTNRWIAQVLMVAACGIPAYRCAAEALVIDYRPMTPTGSCGTF
jgi:hypothetical protein